VPPKRTRRRKKKAYILYLKNENENKRTEGMVQVVECLPSIFHIQDPGFNTHLHGVAMFAISFLPCDNQQLLL
jgi:hypothetical protein